jgi:hypothetical protein
MMKLHDGVKFPVGDLYVEHLNRSGSLSPDFATIVESAKAEASRLRNLIRSKD